MSDWSAVVPVRGWVSGKSRLGIPGIARAMALDTITCLLACPDISEVRVVTRDPAVAADVATRGCVVIEEPANAGLNAAISEAARTRHTTNVVVVLGDLPCLEPADVTFALTRCHSSPSFIADAHGTGTTMWLTRLLDVETHFGSRSRARHRFAGASELVADPGDDPAAWARLRRDVDDMVDLADARRLGLGPMTSAVLDA